jgi:hypothetical protein
MKGFREVIRWKPPSLFMFFGWSPNRILSLLLMSRSLRRVFLARC